MTPSDPLRETREFEATRDALRHAVSQTLPDTAVTNSRHEQQRRLRAMPRIFRRAPR